VLALRHDAFAAIIFWTSRIRLFFGQAE
jgi:hypothetical protein